MSTLLRAPLKCTEPGCDCSGGGPFALHRPAVIGGPDVFTGMATDGGVDPGMPVRLDDWLGPLDGPGHVVTEVEFTAHMCFYPNTTLGIRPVKLKGLLPASAVIDQHTDVIAHTNDDHVKVRASDRVRVSMAGRLKCGHRVVEHFTILVHAVIPHAPHVLVGTSVHKLKWLAAPGHTEPLNEDLLIQVPMNKVLSITHGEYWD